MPDAPSQPWVALSELLRADGPHGRHTRQLGLFGQFVGSWDLQVRFFDVDGRITYDAPGQWRFGWILDGRAIQDVIVYPNAGDEMSNEVGRRRIGTTLRFYHPSQQVWNIVWLGAVTGDVGWMTARAVPPEIWLESTESDGTRNRWVFLDITPDRFRWRGSFSEDDGKSWTLDQEMFATRSGRVVTSDATR
jgi:hypothetical protein